jgi:hypothetical protein
MKEDKILKDCPDCKKQPIILKGINVETQESCWTVICNNPLCKTNPSTGKEFRRKKAVGCWNNNIITDSLWSKP